MSKLKQQRQDKSIDALNGSNNNGFNFDLWAAKVRPQLIAALRKRVEK